MYAGYEALPDGITQKIQGMKTVNVFQGSASARYSGQSANAKTNGQTVAARRTDDVFITPADRNDAGSAAGNASIAQSSDTPMRLPISPPFSASSLMSLANDAGVPAMGLLPCSMKNLRTSGVLTMAAISR